VTTALLDTSTLVAGMLSDHKHHAESVAWLAAAKAGRFELVVSGHSLAEAYSVLTRLPRTPKITPAEAKQLLTVNVTSVAKIVSLSGLENVTLLDEMVSRNVVGGWSTTRSSRGRRNSPAWTVSSRSTRSTF